MNKDKNVLITGGAGFLGSSLALQLISNGYNITVLDNLSQQVHGDKPLESDLYLKIKDKVKFIRGCVTSKSAWKKALKNINTVVHYAAETGTGQSMYKIEKYTDVNIKGTSLLLEILRNEKHNVKKIIVASSRAIYGEGKYRCIEHGLVYPDERQDKDMFKKDFNIKCPVCNCNVELLPTDEESKIHPSSVYGITKYTQEQLVMVAGKAMNIPAVAFRYQNVYGPGQSLSNPYTGILSIFSTIIKNGNEINIFEDGRESRDFVYIDDAVNATILGIEKEKANNEVFNVGTGKSVDVMKVATTLKKAYNSDVEIKIMGNYRLGDIRNNCADLTKIRKILGFAPKVDFNIGIQKFVDWVNSQAIKDDVFEKSIEEMESKGLYK